MRGKEIMRGIIAVRDIYLKIVPLKPERNLFMFPR